MRNLTEVMSYFTRTSGALATMPLKTNRPVDFGMTEDPYNTGRIQPIGMFKLEEIKLDIKKESYFRKYIDLLRQRNTNNF